MLIEFKIQLDDRTGIASVLPSANASQNLPAAKQLGQVFSEVNGKNDEGGDPPMRDPGTGMPHSSGSGMLFVVGPIVICGSGPGHIGPGGDAPMRDPGTGKPTSGPSAAMLPELPKTPIAGKTPTKRTRSKRS